MTASTRPGTQQARLRDVWSEIADRARRVIAGSTTSAGRLALSRGVAPALVHQSMLRRLQPDFVVDVGANRGQFTLDVLRAAPGATVWAFEPLEPEADIFESAVGPRAGVHLDRRGLWSATGRLEMYTSAAADSSSMLPIGDLQSSVFPGTELAGRAWVDVVRLDEVISPDDINGTSLLKIDVQGSELEVLIGAGALLDALDSIYVELSLVSFYVGQPLAAEVIAYLGSCGFDLVDIGPVTRQRGRALQFDGLFQRESSFDAYRSTDDC